MVYRIDQAKIVNYLFSNRSAESAGKSKFFQSAGFDPVKWQVLAAALLGHPQAALLEYTDASGAYGTKYIFICDMPVAPNGKIYCMRSVWQERDDGFRWFVTAYPRHTP
jgi:hypothetical protein